MLIPWHMGALHPVEQALTLALAFGPFVVLGIVIAVRRRQERREDAAAETSETSETAGSATSAEDQRDR